jgi:hypothetical protein
MQDEHVSKTIAMVQAQVLDLERQLADRKRMVNSLCDLIGRARVYADTEPRPGASIGIRGDEFYGKPLASAVRSILEKRAAAGLWAAELDEIFDAMKLGGFRFDAKNDVTARRSLAISLAKNSVTFHRLPNGTIGLTEWYPEVKVKNGKKDDAKTVVATDTEADDDDGFDHSQYDNKATTVAADSKTEETEKKTKVKK